MEINIHQAKTHFSRLIQRVEAGEEITIARAGKPVAKMVAIIPEQGERQLGSLQGQIYIADDFDAPLPDDLLALFNGEAESSGERARKNPGRAKPGKPAKKRSGR
jgi:prevent-host-death family protein